MNSREGTTTAGTLWGAMHMFTGSFMQHRWFKVGVAIISDLMSHLFAPHASQMKWHEICLSTPAAILEVLNAWENGALTVEAVQV